MDRQTTGTVVSVRKQWWLKVNTKMARLGPLDGATFPYVIKVSYCVEGVEYFKRKWIAAGQAVPMIGSTMTVIYYSEKPSKAKIL